MLTPVHLTRSLCVAVIFRLILDLLLNRSPQSARNVKKQLGQINSVTCSQGGGSYLPYILLNEIQTMFSLLAKRSARVLPADLCSHHAHYVKNHRSTVLRKKKNMAVEGGTVSHYYILVIRKFIDFMSLFRHSMWFSFSVKQFPFAEFGICNI